MQPEPVRYRFTVADYHRMTEAGVFGRDARVELIEGEIIEMPPIGPVHAGTVDTLGAEFSQRLGRRAIVRIQGPIVPDEHSEPQPDLCLLRPRADYYKTSHPDPGDILLVVEVAASTLAFDRDVKARIYAGSGIAEYWLFDLTARALLVHRDPRLSAKMMPLAANGTPGPGVEVRPPYYATLLRFCPGDRVAPQAFSECVIDLAAILE